MVITQIVDKCNKKYATSLLYSWDGGSRKANRVGLANKKNRINDNDKVRQAIPGGTINLEAVTNLLTFLTF